MVVAVQLDFSGATLEQYDEMNERIGLLPGGPTAAPEDLFHWVTKTEDGLRVVDVWESRQAFERFAQEELSPVFQRLGILPPRVQFFQLHNYLAGGRGRR